jgi:predicted protein tyrosine phosphatase
MTLWTKNICAREAEEIKYLPENTVLISINEEHGNFYPLQVSIDDRVLRLRFSDVTTMINHRDGNQYLPISRETANKVVNFIEENKDKNFIVHCAAGVSRSSAVCMYIHLKYGHALRNAFWSLSEPNSFVLGRLFIEAKRPLIN